VAILVAKPQGGGGSPVDAQYVVMVADATLTNERVLTAGTGIAITDGGAGNPVTVAANADILGASYVMMGLAGTLTSERVLTAGTGVTITDGGAGGNVTVAASAGVLGASFVTMALSGTLTDERVLTGTASRIVVTDGGAGAAVTLSPGALIVQTDQANTWTVGGQQITIANPANTGLTLQMAAAQTANGFVIKNSAGAVLSGADERGVLFSHAWLNSTNLILGEDAGNTTATGLYNVIAGKDAGRSITTANQCVYIGRLAGDGNTTGTGNFGLGASSCRVGTGNNNVAIGTNALSNSTGVSSSVAVGESALRDSLGSSATAIGRYAGILNVSAVQSVFIGASAGQGAAAYSAIRQVCIGMEAGINSGTNSHYNVFIGYRAGYTVTTGASNIMIGPNAGGAETTNSNRLYIANSNTITPLIYGLFSGAGAGLTIYSQNAAGVPLTVQAIAAQASNLQNWNDAAGTALMEVEATGELDFRWAMGNSTKDPTADAPADWVEVKIGGVVRYLAAYAA